METFIKLYDWTTQTGFNHQKRIVFSLIHQFTETKDGGFWGGYSLMSKRTGIPKSICKKIVEELASNKQLPAIIISRKTISKKTRILLSSNPDYTRLFI